MYKKLATALLFSALSCADTDDDNLDKKIPYTPTENRIMQINGKIASITDGTFPGSESGDTTSVNHPNISYGKDYDYPSDTTREVSIDDNIKIYTKSRENSIEMGARTSEDISDSRSLVWREYARDFTSTVLINKTLTEEEANHRMDFIEHYVDSIIGVIKE